MTRFFPAVLAACIASTAAAQPPAATNARAPLAPPYTAVVQVQLVDAEPGGYVGEQSSAHHRGRTSAAAGLALETEHMALGRSWDFSLTFDAAARPLFVMVKTGDAAVVPAFVPGWSTATGFRLSHATRSTETALVGDIGGAR